MLLLVNLKTVMFTLPRFRFVSFETGRARIASEKVVIKMIASAGCDLGTT